MNNYFSIPFNALIKLCICGFCVIQTNLMRHNKTRRCLSSDDQVSQLAVVGFNIALTSAKREALCRWLKIFKPGVENNLTFSKSFPKLKLIIPFADAVSPAPGSLNQIISLNQYQPTSKGFPTLVHRGLGFPAPRTLSLLESCSQGQY